MNKAVSRLKFILSCAIFIIILCISYSRYIYIGTGLAYLISLSILLSPSFTLRKHNMKKENALTVDKITAAVKNGVNLLPPEGKFVLLISQKDENHIIIIDRLIDKDGKINFMIGEAKYCRLSVITDTLDSYGFNSYYNIMLSSLPNGDESGIFVMIDSHLRPVLTNILGGR